MANTPQARKRARQNDNRRLHNAGMRAMMRTQIKKILKAIEAGDKEAAAAAYKSAVPIIDRVADKRMLHKNKASRQKSRLNARVRAMT